jgi:hypothetical protein
LNVITFASAAGGTFSWVAPFNLEISGITSNVSALVSTNPSRTLSNFTAPPSDQIFHELSINCPVSSNALFQLRPQPLKIPVAAGTRVFVGLSSAGAVQLFFDQVLPAV